MRHSSTKNSFRILTYNIHKGFSMSNRRFVLHEIKHAVMETGADILLLQEVYGEHNEWRNKLPDWPDESQFEFIADQIWPHHAYAKNAVYDEGHHGNAILSKFPISEWHNLDVSLMKKASRSLLHARIDCPVGQPLHLICVHLGLFGFERRRQMETLSAYIRKEIPADAPLIVAGDFNDWLLRARKHFSAERGLDEAFKNGSGRYARSYPSWLPMLKMDRIYSRGLETVSIDHLTGPHWRRLSDHTPLLAEFRFPDQARIR